MFLYLRIVLRVGMAFATALLANQVWPLYACGCGVYLPREADSGGVLQERALLRWDGRNEEILMELDVVGQASEAAWILPVPARAQVKLGDSQLFHALFEWTKPVDEERRHYAIPGFGEASEGAVGGAWPVTVLEQLALGPFEVTNLAASNATALAGWLKTNGYSFPAELAKVLQPYVDQKWYYVAVRLQPAQASDKLEGELNPLSVSFPSAKLIYPMRATALATAPLPVTLYVLADHRTNKSANFGTAHITFADWLDPANLPAGSPLLAVVQQRQFLTKFEDVVYPEKVNGDFEFSFAAQDALFHSVNVHYVDDYSVFYILACGIPLLLLLFLIVGALHLRRRQASTPVT